MTTFLGHLVPAVGFLLYAIYYSVLTSLALLQEQRVLQHPMLPRKLGGHKLAWQVSYEALAKVVFPIISIFGEWFFPIGVNRFKMIDWKDPRRPFVFKAVWEHITMFGFFVLSGVVDLVCQSHPSSRWSLKLERAAEALTLYVLALMMISHAESKTPLDNRVHLLLVVLAFLLALVATVEIWLPDQAPLWVLKCWLGMVFSTWLMQICEMFIPLTGQPWQKDSPTDMAFVTIFFCWHLALAAALLTTIYGLCRLWHCRSSSRTKTPSTRYQRCPMESSGEELEKLRAEAEPQDGGA
ncbi:transmembrane epididymal protein 1A-like [Meriones unguiculatus]|uniref:transmembrane epididymal protein 1A-like n=1 Tax=Meriones unguiculatus TaxID=10047 RepID=UPI000B4FC209|nr:transmembrane epididymal protein 1A-like [Meriones unguiculatus]